MSQATAWITQARPSKLLEMEAEKVGAATSVPNHDSLCHYT